MKILRSASHETRISMKNSRPDPKKARPVLENARSEPKKMRSALKITKSVTQKSKRFAVRSRRLEKTSWLFSLSFSELDPFRE